MSYFMSYVMLFLIAIRFTMAVFHSKSAHFHGGKPSIAPHGPSPLPWAFHRSLGNTKGSNMSKRSKHRAGGKDNCNV